MKIYMRFYFVRRDLVAFGKKLSGNTTTHYFSQLFKHLKIDHAGYKLVNNVEI